MTPQVSLSTPLTCVLSHLSLSHTGETGSLPINNDTLAAFAVGEPAVVSARATTAARIISNQSAGSTQKLYLAHFTRWHNFATRRGVPSIPADNQSYQALRKQVACLDAFAADMYHQHSTRWQSAGHTGRAAGNKSGTFNQIFYGINHVITKIYGRPPLRSSFIDQAKASYKRDFSRPTKKSRPLRGRELAVWSNSPRPTRYPCPGLP